MKLHVVNVIFTTCLVQNHPDSGGDRVLQAVCGVLRAPVRPTWIRHGDQPWTVRHHRHPRSPLIGRWWTTAGQWLVTSPGSVSMFVSSLLIWRISSVLIFSLTTPNWLLFFRFTLRRQFKNLSINHFYWLPVYVLCYNDPWPYNCSNHWRLLKCRFWRKFWTALFLGEDIF